MRAAASVIAVNGTAIDTDASGMSAAVHASTRSVGGCGVCSVSPKIRPDARARCSAATNRSAVTVSRHKPLVSTNSVARTYGDGSGSSVLCNHSTSRRIAPGGPGTTRVNSSAGSSTSASKLSTVYLRPIAWASSGCLYTARPAVGGVSMSGSHVRSPPMSTSPIETPTTTVTAAIAADDGGVPFDAHGIEPIPDGSRDCSPWELFWIWSGANIAPINWVLGRIGNHVGAQPDRDPAGRGARQRHRVCGLRRLQRDRAPHRGEPDGPRAGTLRPLRIDACPEWCSSS